MLRIFLYKRSEDEIDQSVDMNCSSQELKERLLAGCRHGICPGLATRSVTVALCCEFLQPVALALGWKNCNKHRGGTSEREGYSLGYSHCRILRVWQLPPSGTLATMHPLPSQTHSMRDNLTLETSMLIELHHEHCWWQADVCHAYQILKKGGLKDENIVVFMYDDIANSEDNPYPGKIFNKPKGPDVYHGVPKVRLEEKMNTWLVTLIYELPCINLTIQLTVALTIHCAILVF